MHDLSVILKIMHDCNENKIDNIVVFECYESEKKLLLRQQTDRIHSFAVLNVFE